MIRRIAHAVVNLRPVKGFLTENRLFVRGYFNYLYRKPDPYSAKTEYQLRKFEHTFALIGDRRFEHGLEIGCGAGINTWRVGQLCSDVLAVDISRNAIRRALAENSRPNVVYQVKDLLVDRFDRRYDYVFCAEMLCYFTLNQLDQAVARILAALEPGGILHLMHSRAVGDDTSGIDHKAFGAKTIHDRFAGELSLEVLQDVVEPKYRVTVYRKR